MKIGLYVRSPLPIKVRSELQLSPLRDYATARGWETTITWMSVKAGQTTACPIPPS
jgi:hypothetical protein